MTIRSVLSSIGNGICNAGSAVGKGVGKAGSAVGKAFKAGWNNGNLALGLQATGMAAMGTAFVAMAIRDMNHNSCNCCGSIFNNNYCNFGGGFNMFNNPYSFGGSGNMFSNPYSFGGGGNMFGNPYSFGGGGNMFSNPYSLGGGNIYSNPYSFGSASNIFTMGNMRNNPLLMSPSGTVSDRDDDDGDGAEGLYAIKRDNNCATKVSSDTDKNEGERVDKAMSDFGTDKKGFKLFDVTTDDNNDYKRNITNLSKSYIANLDSDNSGYIEFDEYWSNENADADDGEKSGLKNSFNRMDLNRDGKIDYKEMSSAFATMDAGNNSDGKLDGQVSVNNMTDFQEGLTDATRTFSDNNWKFYKKLFDIEE